MEEEKSALKTLRDKSTENKTSEMPSSNSDDNVE